MSRFLFKLRNFELLEPYDAKVSCTVLRGESSRKGADLLDKDLFEISLLNYQMEIIKQVQDVFFDELVEVIDNEVEKVHDYENRVKQEYSLI